MYCKIIANCIENAESMIIRPSWSFNFISLKSCGAHFTAKDLKPVLHQSLSFQYCCGILILMLSYLRCLIR